MSATFIDRLACELDKNDYLAELFEKASLVYGSHVTRNTNDSTTLADQEFVDVLRFADLLSCTANAELRNKGFHIISLLYPVYRNDPIFQKFAKAVFLKLGNFPSAQFLVKHDNNQAELPFERVWERCFKETTQAVPFKKGLVFTDVQYELFKKLSVSRFFSFSGPTSVGKSFIICSFLRKVIANTPPSNIVVMVPTRALISQFSIDLNSDLRDVLSQFSYRISTNSMLAHF